MLCPCISCLILSGAHYRFVLIFHVYLVLPLTGHLPEITEISILSSFMLSIPHAYLLTTVLFRPSVQSRIIGTCELNTCGCASHITKSCEHFVRAECRNRTIQPYGCICTVTITVLLVTKYNFKWPYLIWAVYHIQPLNYG